MPSLFSRCLLACFLVSLLSPIAAARPNILLILADDMGYGDLGVMGSETVRSPHLDELAQSGVLCTQAYVASAVCSPSRAGLVTGRDPRRFGYEGNLNETANGYAARPELLGLPRQEHTLADHLKAVGYRTALVGKWHLGTGDGFHPNRRGFDYFCGMLGGGHNYFPKPSRNRLERNGEPLQSFSSPYLTDFFTDEAVDWISLASVDEDDSPWLMYLSYNAPHTPMQATEEDLAACEHVADPGRRTYAAMMLALDRGVGRVVRRLDELGERENTLIVFLSDNGGATNNSSWNGPLSGAKGSLREGGIRVPMIWNWPGRIDAGRVEDAVVSSLDLLPTFLAAAGGKPLPLKAPPSYYDAKNEQIARRRLGHYDGVDLMPVLEKSAAVSDRTLFWRLQGQAAIRRGDLKLVRLSHRPADLFQVESDPAEQTNLAGSAPSERERLLAELGEWESLRPTVPIWDSSPRWHADSARIYDNWQPRDEPQ
ncbi:MAG: sulfatase-like hydrolase/transferase [Planctomycetota bacterium]